MPEYKYFELKRELVFSIRNGHYRQGDLLESEAVLQKRFQLSRNTVRQALSELENEGFISRYRGKGTIVANTDPCSSRKVALVLYNVALMLNPITADMIRGIDEALASENYTLDILAGNRDLCGEKIQSLFNTYAGILIGAAEIDDALLREFLKSPVPCIFLKNYRRDYRGLTWRIDFETAGAMAAEHLIANGINDLGVIYTNPQFGITGEFLQGVRQACLENGAKLRSVNVIDANEQNRPETMEKLTAMLSSAHSPRGVVCFTDTFARMVQECAATLNIKIPEQLAITGCNDSDISRSWPVTLTSLKIPIRELGFTGAGELLRRIRGEQPGKPVVLKPELVIRESSGGAK